ncbi:MAG: PepSY domain-containing protein [Alphaproteobacteria bacterium]|nr:PepSY domain-containing protein [Alphaproteobacteria bacterium]
MKTAPILVALMLLAPPALAGSDHDRARQALRSGQVLPLAKILEKVAADIPGEVIETELEEEKGRFIYEIKLITPQGRVMKLIYDATDATLLKSREKEHK